jgi:hypothetical protein
VVGETKNKKTVSETNLLAGNTTSVESPGTLVQGLLRCEKNSNSEQTKERTEEKQRGAGEHANGQQTTGLARTGSTGVATNAPGLKAAPQLHTPHTHLAYADGRTLLPLPGPRRGVMVPQLVRSTRVRTRTNTKQTNHHLSPWEAIALGREAHAIDLGGVCAAVGCRRRTHAPRPQGEEA